MSDPNNQTDPLLTPPAHDPPAETPAPIPAEVPANAQSEAPPLWVVKFTNPPSAPSGHYVLAGPQGLALTVGQGGDPDLQMVLAHAVCESLNHVGLNLFSKAAYDHFKPKDAAASDGGSN